MSLDFLNDLLLWAIGSGGFTLGIFGLFGGGGGSAPKYPTRRINKTMRKYVSNTKSDISKLLKDVNTQGQQLTDRVEDVVASGDESLGEREQQLTASVENQNRELLDSQTTLGDRFLEAVRGAKTEFDADFERSMDLSPERLSLFTQAADRLSQAAVETRARMLATADPRALELSAIADENAAAMMSGRISADMQANLARSGAMRALQGGFGASSQMGRGLVARDLGLTSLQLQQQGLQDFDRQRRLNFVTRAAGLQANAGALLADNQAAMRQRAATNYEVGINVAESDRNQRSDAFNRVYGTNVGVAGNIFSTGASRIGQTTDMMANTAGRVFGANVEARGMGFEALNDARKSFAATRVNALQNQWAAESAQAASNQSNRNALFGNLLQTGATIAGTVAGSFAGNPMAGYQIGSTVGSIGNQAVSGNRGGGLSSLGSFQGLGSILGGNRGYDGYTNYGGGYVGYKTATLA